MNREQQKPQGEDKNEYVNRLQYIGKLKREWYMRGVKEEFKQLRKLLKEMPCKHKHHESYPDECCYEENINDFFAKLKV